MSNQLITKENNERVKAFFASLDRLPAILERLFTIDKIGVDYKNQFTDIVEQKSPSLVAGITCKVYVPANQLNKL